MKSLVLILFSLLVSGSLACSALDNSMSQIALDCGDDAAKGEAYVKVLDPQGNALDASLLNAKLLDEAMTSVAVSSRGCIATRPLAEHPIVVSSTFTDRIWGSVLRADEIPLLRSVRLGDVSQADLGSACPSVIYTSGLIADPVLPPQGLREAFPHTLELSQNSLALAESLQLTDKGQLQLASTMSDGPFEVKISYKNLFLNNSAAKALHCSYHLDRKAPQLKHSLKHRLNPELYKVLPGESISLQSEDENPGQIAFCLHKADERGPCASHEAFKLSGPETSFQAPQSGHWCVDFFASDKAAQVSPTESACFIVFQGGEIENIQSLNANARLQIDSDQLGAALGILRSLKKYLGLATAEEKAAVAQDIFSSAVQVNTQASEINRIILKEPLSDLQLLDSDDHFIGLTQTDLQLWNAQGQLLDRFASPGEGLVKASVGQARVILYSPFDWHILHRVGTRFEELPSALKSDSKEIGVSAWHPQEDEYLIANLAEGELKIFRFKAGAYQLAQSFPISGADAALWSGSGRYLMTRGEKGLHIFERLPDGTYSALASREESVSGYTFLNQASEETLVYLNSIGDVKTWKAAKGFEDFHINTEGFGPDTLVKNSILHTSDETFLFFQRDEIRSMDMAKAYTSIGGLPIPQEYETRLRAGLILDWSQDPLTGDLRFLVEEAGMSRAFFFKRPAHSPKWILSKELQLSRSQILQALALPSSKTLVSVDDGRNLRFWSEQTLAKGFRTGSKASHILKWVPQGDRPAAIASGADHGVARLWSRDGEGLLDFTHRPMATLSLSDLTWNKAQNRYLTVGADARIVIWNAKAEQLGELDETNNFNQGKNRHRYTALFLGDDKTIVSLGDSSFGLWIPDESGYQARKAFFRTDEFISHGPGDIQLFRWNQQEIMLAKRQGYEQTLFAFFDRAGEEVALLKNPPASVQALRLSDDGRYLVIQEAGRPLSLYRLDEMGFQKIQDLPASSLNWALLSPDLKWSPDGKLLSGVFTNDRLVFWQMEGEELKLKAQKSFSLGPSTLYDNLWWPDSKAFAYTDQNEIKIVDSDLNPVHQPLRPFTAQKSINKISLSPDGKALATTAGGTIQIVPFQSLEETRELMCKKLGDFFRNSNEFDLSPELKPEDRKICD